MVFMTMVKNVAAPFFIMPLGSAAWGGGTNGIYVFYENWIFGLINESEIVLKGCLEILKRKRNGYCTSFITSLRAG
jgi:hypothetical protein